MLSAEGKGMEEAKGRALPSAMALAYLGDAVHSLYVRGRLVDRGISKSGALNDAARAYVTAAAQAEAAARLADVFTEEEADVFRRAGNSHHLNRPKNASGADYRAATGFEAVLGMLHYLGRHDRIALLLEIAYPPDEGL